MQFSSHSLYILYLVLVALEKICRKGNLLVLVEPAVLDHYFTWYLWLLRRSVGKVIFLFLLNLLFLILTLPGTCGSWEDLLGRWFSCSCWTFCSLFSPGPEGAFILFYNPVFCYSKFSIKQQLFSFCRQLQGCTLILLLKSYGPFSCFKSNFQETSFTTGFQDEKFGQYNKSQSLVILLSSDGKYF